jgi:lysosomal acid phosphatase
MNLRKNTLHLTLIFCFTLLAISAFAQEKLVFAVTLIRHGDRTPTCSIPKDPHHWEIGIGELTPHGMHQEYLLGKKLRKRYIDTYHLLPPIYKNSSMYVRSTEFNRTLMSVESLLCGFYPLGLGPKFNGIPALPAGYQPIPIRTYPEEQDYILLSKDNNVKKYNKMIEKYVFPSKNWKNMTAQHEKDFKRWSEILGIKINNLKDMMEYGDNLYVRKVNNVPMPKGISKEEADKIIYLSNWTRGQLYKPQEISCFIAKPFLEKLIKDMQNIIDNKQSYKYLLYSGHDSSILPVMSAIGAPLDTTPPYASHLDFELYKNSTNYYIKIRFNDNFVKLPIESNNNEYLFSNFTELVKERCK